MPANNKLLDLSQKIGTEDPKFIDIAFNKLLLEINKYSDINTLLLVANGLENRHLPLLEQALSDHRSILKFSIAYNSLNETGPDLASFLLFLVTKNPNLQELSISACDIDDNEFKNIFETLLPTGAISRVYIDFSRNYITSKSADLALQHTINRCTLDTLKSNNHLTKGNKQIRHIIDEVLDGDSSKKSPVLTAYLDAQLNKNCSVEVNEVTSGIKTLKLVK